MAVLQLQGFFDYYFSNLKAALTILSVLGKVSV